MPLVPHQEWDFIDPLVVVGFPSQGLVGAIVASYVVPKLEMELVASMDSPHLPPVASVRNGHAFSPVQCFASTQRCGLDGECSQLVVVRSDAEPNSQGVGEISEEILTWAQQIGAERVVTLEGAPLDDQGDDQEAPPVFAVPNNCCSIDHEKLGAQPFPDGALSGISASLLVEGNSMDLGVICLFTGVHEGAPDASAAARLVDVVDVLVPGIKMDPEPLEEQAKRFEAQLRASVEEGRKAQGKPEDASEMMYG